MGKQCQFIFGGSKITADGDCSNEIKRHLLLGRKTMTNLDSILKSRDIKIMFDQKAGQSDLLSSVQSLSCVQLFVTPQTAAHQASLSITNSRNLLKLMPIKSVMPSNHLILCVPFSSCLQSFPASESYPMSQFFTSGGQSIGASASASVLSMK